jgi:hypothetical protein
VGQPPKTIVDVTCPNGHANRLAVDREDFYRLIRGGSDATSVKALVCWQCGSRFDGEVSQ